MKIKHPMYWSQSSINRARGAIHGGIAFLVILLLLTVVL